MENGVIMQFFEWNLPNDGKLWKQLQQEAAHLKKRGISAIWIPPAYKADEQADEGYATYDLYDLGEFDQKGTIRTKYGTCTELKQAIQELHRQELHVYLDAVLNHKSGADYTERFVAQEVDELERNVEINKPVEIEAATGYKFPGRKDQYSDFKWHWYHFTGVGDNLLNNRQSIYCVHGKQWSQGVDVENGNYDYLLCNDIDLQHPEVITELNKWGLWVTGFLQLDGFRMDAIKHMDKDFVKQFIDRIRQQKGDDFFFVGEYWHRNYNVLLDYLSYMDHSIHLFDVPLHFKMHYASCRKEDFDFRDFMENTLVSSRPGSAVTFVENHDTQEGCSLESVVDEWFKPFAYGIILLMKWGYPCVFYGDYYGIGGKPSKHRYMLDVLLDARSNYAYGEQYDYYDEPKVAGFTRLGDERKPDSGLAFLFSIEEDACKQMFVGERHAGEIWQDITGNIEQEILIEPDGKASFPVKGCSMSVWVVKKRPVYVS